jgi:hypothetical protein
MILLDSVLQIFVRISVFICALLHAPIFFGAIVLTLGLRLML